VFQGVLTSGDVSGLELEDTAERDKRQIKEPLVQASFGIKSALLNIIFGVMFTFLLRVQHKLTLTSPAEGKTVTALYSVTTQNLIDSTQDKGFQAFDAVKIGIRVSIICRDAQEI
jgi:predicted ABC-type exoprotein transport system permease subunit